MVRHAPEPTNGPLRTRLSETEKTLESLREDSEIAHVLLGLSAALAEVRTAESTLGKSVRVVRELFRADRCFAAMWDGPAERFRVRASFGFDRAQLLSLERITERAIGPAQLRATLDRGSPVLIPDVDKDERIAIEEARERGLRSYIGIPLMRSGQDFGVLGVEFTGPREFTPKHAALAGGIARQVGVALANARRFKLLQGLRSSGLRIGGRLNLRDVTREIAEAARDLLGGSGGLVYLRNPADQSLTAAASVGLPRRVVEAMGRLTPEHELWQRLAEDRTFAVTALPTLLDIEEAPFGAVGTVIPGAHEPLGVLIVFSDRPVTLCPDESEALNVLAAQSASAVDTAQRFQRQRSVARSLQSGILRVEIPKLRGFQIHAIYEPASGESDIGGDYYDVFDLYDDRVAIVVGDVAGKGAEAAAHTAMAKYMLRAFAIRNPAPDSVLFHLNNALTKGLQADEFTTLTYALIDTSKRKLIAAVGGHPNPLLFRAATGEIEIVHAEGGIVGAFAGQSYEHTEIRIDDGDVFVAYTDGLSETRSPAGHLFGTRRIRESLRKHAALPASKIARAIFDDALAFGTVTDDAVVLALTARESEE